MSHVDPVASFKGMFLIVALCTCLSTKQTCIMTSVQVCSGTLIRFKRVLFFLFIVWNILSAKFWCWWCAWDYQSSMNKYLSMTFTLRLIYDFTLCKMSLSIWCCVLKCWRIFYQTSFHKHQWHFFRANKCLCMFWFVIKCRSNTPGSVCVYWIISSLNVEI